MKSVVIISLTLVIPADWLSHTRRGYMHMLRKVVVTGRGESRRKRVVLGGLMLGTSASDERYPEPYGLGVLDGQRTCCDWRLKDGLLIPLASACYPKPARVRFCLYVAFIVSFRLRRSRTA